MQFGCCSSFLKVFKCWLNPPATAGGTDLNAKGFKIGKFLSHVKRSDAHLGFLAFYSINDSSRTKCQESDSVTHLQFARCSRLSSKDALSGLRFSCDWVLVRFRTSPLAQDFAVAYDANASQR